ncbi:uncharacterized protein LOC122276697 [Carya illinoinensis]|uniref:RRM domain-containing protein n=1 Tax=Carya illinoinensis TaxID=32201 RepID=A0A8T1RPD8_CARIL|nr:uncharacterized protein LOC122276697 [Carya illinoinensis]XP_042942539.1 uncharacterized protein LOC122276697 [Carya illinoinensis]XP_042942547.1 uncharacterized protein LOC122276697 [Carya illinoinensis]KAG6668579.1 hypothetical protein CIPAW_01G180800 [Carya illinoinensis]KAG6732476.1 hypothetical protein I3842_01G180300 [Carya illinoinensis]KAG6732477.1 hypothetical protein I3842_01G180300 [Carya illinoinensis]KAG6732478.1 hypothetical protein I3842_01G180300 [Carya illinoinensis]KAG67
MSRSIRVKEKHEKSSAHSLHDRDEGSAARTRPFSFDEIMLRRENKKSSESLKEEAIKVGNISKEGIIENVSDQFESEKGTKYNRSSSPIVEKHVSEKSLKMSSRKKEENLSMKKDALFKGKNRESHESDRKLKDKQNNDMNYKAKLGRNDRQHGRRKDEEWFASDAAIEVEKKHSRDLVTRERHADRIKGESERGNKRRYRNGDDEKSRDRNTIKKHDLGKQRDLDVSERKESSKSHYEESRSKRRRSRSREHEDRSRRSISLSPRAHKHKSHHGGQRREFSSHSLKDRSRRQDSEIDKNRVSINGSSSHYQRHGGYTSGLGGYSPRKRRIEAAVKTSSPSDHSPEKKSAGWDLPPVKTAAPFSPPVPSYFQSLNQAVASTVNDTANAFSVASTTTKSLSGVANTFATRTNASIDSVQLTQATRPMRRLYVENIPSSASEKDVMECFNNLLMSSGVSRNHPCFNCTINKGQALVEFLTPEDASAALSFDGNSFSGSILKIKRPKDFIEVATGDLEKSVATVDTISDRVKDSPNKIFIGGISKYISSKMLMEVVSVFGPLKAYHFEVNKELSEPCAFLEYVDQSVTHKACAGLNGMKLGGRVLTVMQAMPGASLLENDGYSPSYGIPEHARSLLKQPTQVLKLKNVFDPEALSSLSDPDVEEVLEDIRLECARFGTVKGVNVVKNGNGHTTTLDGCKVIEVRESAGALQDSLCNDRREETDTSRKDVDHEPRQISEVDVPSGIKEIKEDVVKLNCFGDDKPADDIGEDTMNQKVQLDNNMVAEDLGCKNIADGIPTELPIQLNGQVDQLDFHDENVGDIIQVKDISLDRKFKAVDHLTLEDTDSKLQEASAGLDSGLAMEAGAMERGGNEELDYDLGHVFEPWCVFVEYGRTEACCMAAHCLHGRLFDNRVVAVEYIALDLYRSRFPK